jgi:hypothetical protein
VTGTVVLIAYVVRIRPWHLRWGATDAEVYQSLPGDELVLHPKLTATHAITIHASAAEVWPWLVQMGQGRAGFYSYDWLENVFGLEIHNADRIIPEYQVLKVGDLVPVAPGGFGPPVVALEPNRVLVLGGTLDTRTGRTLAASHNVPAEYHAVSWVFFLEPVDAKTTRLIERFRADWSPSLRNALFNRVLLEPASFVMERKMLLGIKERAERKGNK